MAEAGDRIREMSIAPQQDWAMYAARTAAEEAKWLRALAPSERFVLYADLFEAIWTARQNQGLGDWERLDRWNWQQKLARRLQDVAGFQKLDEIRNGRAAPTHTG